MEGSSTSSSASASAGANAAASTGTASVTAAPGASETTNVANPGGEAKATETVAKAVESTEKADAALSKEQKAEEKKVHAFLERMAKLTQKQYNSADEALDDAEEHWQKNDHTIENYKKDDEMVYEVVKKNPQMAKIIYDMYNDVPFEAALALHYDRDSLVPPEGSDNHKAYTESVEQRKQNIAKHEALLKTIDANFAETDKSFASFIEKNKVDDAGATALRTFISGLLEDAYNGKVGEPVFEMGHYYLNKDKQLQEARESGEIAKRNEKIEVEKEKLNSVGDGLAHLNAAATEVTEAKKPEKPANPFTDAIDSFNLKRRRFPD